MQVIIAFGLVITGYLILVATFSRLGRFGINPTKGGLLIILMALIASAIGPTYDLMLWMIL